MVNGIGTIYLCDFDKRFGSKFRVGFRIQHETPEEGRRTYRPKRCEYNKKENDDSTNTLNDKNSAKRYEPHSKKSYPEHDTILYLMVRLLFMRSRKCEVPSLPLFPNTLWSGVVVHVKVP